MYGAAVPLTLLHAQASNEYFKAFKSSHDPRWFERVKHCPDTWVGVACGLSHVLFNKQLANNLPLSSDANPAKLGNLFSMKRACVQMQALGADRSFWENPALWEDNKFGPDAFAGDVHRVNPLELTWNHLRHTLLPDYPRPRIDVNTPEFLSRCEVMYLELVQSQLGMLGPGADEGKLREECRALARTRVEQQMQGYAVANVDLASMQGLENACMNIMSRATEGPTARFEAQRSCIALVKQFLQQDEQIPEAWVAVRNFITAECSKSPTKNFMRTTKKVFPPAMSNLSEFGAWLAEELLTEEVLARNYGTHRQATVFFDAVAHTAIKSSMQINQLLLGAAQNSKTFLLDGAFLKTVPGTLLRSLGMSDKADLVSQTRDIDFKAVLLDELPPTMIGVQEGISKNRDARGDQGMTDKASRWRSGATGTKIDYQRNVKDQQTGKYTRELVQVELHRSYHGCMNLEPWQVPANGASRFLRVQCALSTRPANYSITSRVLHGLAENLKPREEEYYHEKRKLHALTFAYSWLFNPGIIKRCMAPGDSFIDEVLQLAADRGLPGSSDIRTMLRCRMLTFIRSLHFALTKLFIDPDSSPFANKPFDLDQMLAVELLGRTSVEAAVFCITRMADQYETNSSTAFAVLHAINLSVEGSPYHRAAKAYEDERAGNKKSAPARDEEDGYAEDYNDMKQKERPRPTLKDHFESDYFDFNIGTISAGSKPGETTVTDYKRCEKLYKFLEGDIKGRHQEGGVEFIHSLLNAQVTGGSGRLIPSLVIKDDGACSIARSLIKNPARNKLIGIVKEVLCRPHYPVQVNICTCSADLL